MTRLVALFLLVAPMWFATAHALLRPARPIAYRADALRPS